MAMPAPRSAAVQIRAPPAEPVREFVPAAKAQGDANGILPDGKKRDTTQRLCRNVLIYGSCRFQDQGCVYYHPPEGEDPTQSLTPETTTHALPEPFPAKGALAIAAPVFVPKTPLSEVPPETTGPEPQSQPQWAMQPEAAGLLGVSGMQLGGGSGYESSAAMEQGMGMDASMYMAQPQVRQALDYNLYTAPLPHVTGPSLSQHPLHGFYIPDDLRRFLSARNEANWVDPQLHSAPTLHNGQTLPAELGVYHSLVPLDPASPPPNSTTGKVNHPPSRVYAHPAPVYRATSSVDGRNFALRRVEGYKLVNEAAFGAIDIWRRMRHPNIVGLREAFTTKAFGDNSLMLVYDFHPDSTTLFDEHMAPTEGPNAGIRSMGRRRAGMPIPERAIWSYITQIANALKAVHSSGLAARNLDPSKVLVTGQNRIRLNGCGILDVLMYDASTPVGVYQQEDLVSFGKLVISLCCEFFTPGQHPGMPLEHISRHYSPDVKNLVMFLISKPGPLKSIDDVIRMLGPRILNELDAAQNYTDVLESDLSNELENSRIVRLLTKMGFINERAEFELDPRWSDSGDRYIIKLFRDYVFHSVNPEGRPILDLSHVMTCLNKLDAGLNERLMLVSRDEKSCLVVTYREIKSCIETAYNELRQSQGTGMMMAR